MASSDTQQLKKTLKKKTQQQFQRWKITGHLHSKQKNHITYHCRFWLNQRDSLSIALKWKLSSMRSDICYHNIHIPFLFNTDSTEIVRHSDKRGKDDAFFKNNVLRTK